MRNVSLNLNGIAITQSNDHLKPARQMCEKVVTVSSPLKSANF